jgi:arginyl-tRNA synthetase
MLIKQRISNTRLFMSTLVGGTRGALHERVKDALHGAFQGTDIEVSDTLVMPTQPQHGDYQTNIAMTLTKKLGMKPKEIADKIVAALKVDDLVSTVNITGPGFITMRLSDTYIQSQILEKAKDRTRLGITKIAAPQRVIVDFSSPNIAKEMHVVSDRLLLFIYVLIY